jgi:hypothetical protein
MWTAIFRSTKIDVCSHWPTYQRCDLLFTQTKIACQSGYYFIPPLNIDLLFQERQTALRVLENNCTWSLQKFFLFVILRNYFTIQRFVLSLLPRNWQLLLFLISVVRWCTCILSARLYWGYSLCWHSCHRHEAHIRPRCVEAHLLPHSTFQYLISILASVIMFKLFSLCISVA